MFNDNGEKYDSCTRKKHGQVLDFYDFRISFKIMEVKNEIR